MQRIDRWCSLRGCGAPDPIPGSGLPTATGEVTTCRTGAILNWSNRSLLTERSRLRMLPLVDAIEIDGYDPGWREAYSAAAVELASALAPWVVAIEHIGSTSVPGLAAKPVIDIQVAVRTLDESHAIVQAVEALGYEYVPELEYDFARTSLLPTVEERTAETPDPSRRAEQYSLVGSTPPFPRLASTS